MMRKPIAAFCYLFFSHDFEKNVIRNMPLVMILIIFQLPLSINHYFTTL